MFGAPVRAPLAHRFRLTPQVLQITRHTANLSMYPPSTQQTSGGLLIQQSLRRRREIFHASLNVAWFHSTRSSRQLPVLLGAIKASTMLEAARTVARVALTFIPFMMFRNHSDRRLITHHDLLHPDRPITEETKATILRYQRSRTLLTHILLFIPAALLWLAVLASAERTPLTGRWRLIVLSPEEEDEIAAQLAGPKWFQAVTNILSHDGPMKLIPAHDWRHQWVQDTLHRLESVIPILQREHELNAHWLDVGPDLPPLPPPAEYPLRPRPRGADRMRTLCDTLYCRKSSPSAHVIAGPPYSLLVADRPDVANAFSYGFGPDGACGIVVYSGFLDDILSKAPVQHSSHRTTIAPRLQESSWFSYLFGSLLGVPPTFPVTPSHPIPTEEQTTELAILLAHEVAHLVLSHHIETVSSGTIIFPTIMSIIADVVRTLVFPVTMFFGPFFNDGIAQVGKIGSGRLIELGESCTSMTQEIEADIVSARLLAYAGFDARKAVAFWDSRGDASECSTKCDNAPPPSSTWQMMGASHPICDVRIEKLKNELARWELEKRVAIRQRAEGMPTKRSPDTIWALL